MRPPSVRPAGDQTAVSTTTALIEAARQAGTLDQLADLARAVADLKAAQKVENAEVFYLLVELARAEGAKVAPRIEARLAELIKENETAPEPASNSGVTRSRLSTARSERLTFPWTDSLVATLALRDKDPAVGRLGERLTQALIKRGEILSDWPVLSRLRGDLAEASARRAGAPEAISASLPALWRPADMRPSYDLARTDSPSVWVAHQGLVAHPAGSATDALLFDYPLTGTYEVSLDAYVGPWAGSVVTLNGLAVLPSARDRYRQGQGFSGRRERERADSLGPVPLAGL